jgi:hypothetical protein
MAHYAFLDQSSVVTQVIAGIDEGTDGIDWEQHYGNFHGATCKRTSYNTYGGVHKFGKTPFRKNYAGIGYTYDPVRNAFIPPHPFPSWQRLNEETCLWEPPVPKPLDTETTIYVWNEEQLSWVSVDLPVTED